MANGLFDARAMLRVKSLAEYRTKHQRVLKSGRAFGLRTTEQIVTAPVSARIEHNRWLLDCPCGSGVAVHPDWPEARCMGEGCGRVYMHVVIPPDRVAIAQELAKRPRLQNRNWLPGETVADLQAEREAHTT